MLCICKREIRSFFHSMIGWVFGAFLLLMAGIYFTAYNPVSYTHLTLPTIA